MGAMLSAREKNLLWGANIWYFAEGMFGPLLAVFAQRVGGNILDITSAWAVFLAVTGVSIMVVGKLSDKLAKSKSRAREKLLILGYSINAACTFAYLLVDGPVDLLLVQAGLGIGVALSSPTWLALYEESSSGHSVGFRWSLTSGTERLVNAVAIVVGGYIVTRYSFEVLFVMMGVIQIVAVIYQAQILRLKK